MGKYNLGLDIGTNSVGWAVVDENNQIVKKGGKALWGVRMFDEAQSAKETRIYRNSRRRIVRRNQRLLLLQKEFYDEIIKVDQTFFQRLKDSFFKKEDKLNKNNYTFFDDDITDREYFKKFPTIYHLRSHLLYNDEKIDIRMLYLALHHIVKYRGHFLDSGEVNESNFSKIKDVLDTFNNKMSEMSLEFEDNEDYFCKIEFDENFENKLKDIMLSQLSKKEKRQELIDLFKVDKKSLVNELLIELLVNKKVKLNSLSITNGKKYEVCEIDFEKEELFEKLEDAKKIITELFDILDEIVNIKKIVDYYYVLKIIGDNEYLSEAMVKKYDKHDKDLRELKSFIKTYCPNKYYECFRKTSNPNLCNYPKYVGINSVNKKIERFAHCKKEEFYKYLKSLFNTIKDENAKLKIDLFQKDMENDDFLNRQNSNHNSSIPMQLNFCELKKILENQSKYYPFLMLKNSDGYSTSDRIIAIFKYKIPYYVGPLNKNSKYSWLVKKSNENITPWNYEKVIDLDASAKEFIQRMQNKCTYLKGENDYCLPKKSILFSEYNCLQYLNRLIINGALIENKLKNEIYENIFLCYKKPTKKSIVEYLKTNYNYDETTLKSNILEVNCDMSSYIQFKEIYGEDFEQNLNIVEDIIKDITIFEDKKILEKRLREIYHLSEDKVQKIKGLNYKGYATLSKHFLNNFYSVNEETGEIYGPIIQIMRDTNYNLQQVIYNDRYNFMKAIDKYNKKNLDTEKKLNVSDFIDEYIYVSPIMKRSLIQSYNIIQELEKILGESISKYYIECARVRSNSKDVINSRYRQLSELYKDCEHQVSDISKNYININKLKKQLEDNKNELRADKLYLYFTQFGKCMYTLKDIDLDNVFLGKYDIDHIYPQSLIKDDSLNNRVLASKEKNGKKDNQFIFNIPEFLPKNAELFYKKLLECKLITKEKYRRLTMKKIDDDELDIFVNRQLVATNQSVKGLVDVLKIYKGVKPTNIVYSKAVNISDFRNNYNLYKSRTANNYHHAHDAYLNVVIGKALDVYYQCNYFQNYKDVIKLKDRNITINPEIILSKNRYVNRNGEKKVIWDLDNTLKLIKNNLYNRFDITETIMTRKSNKMFSKSSISPAKNSKNLIPIKTSDPRCNVLKYGGIKSNSYNFYCIVELYDKKGKKSYILEAIPKTHSDKLEEYIKNSIDEKNVSNFKIINKNIKSNIIIEYKKLRYVITGKSGKYYLIKNFKDRNFSYNAIKTIKYIEKYNYQKKYEIPFEETKEKIILAPKKKDTKEISLTLDNCQALLDEIISLFKKDIYNYDIIYKITSKLEENKQNLTLTNLIKVLTEILILLKTNERGTADLTLIDMSKDTGTLCISKTLKPGMKFISESPTGYYRKIIFEVPNGI